MRISAKGRYALAATIYMANHTGHNECVTLISISEKLGISKIYLEQVYSLLKRGEIVLSIKGAQGGYQLTKSPSQITAYDILNAIETSLFEKTEQTVSEHDPAIEHAMHSILFDKMKLSLQETLQNITLQDLADEATQYEGNHQLMFFI